MAKNVKVGVHRGDSEPSFNWNVLILDMAFEEAMGFLDEAQYQHVATQVQELARELDPTRPVTQTCIASVGIGKTAGRS
jgi:hypothetical protein